MLPLLIKKAELTRGFTLVQVSIILTVAALVMVAVLPGYQTKLNADSISTTRMNAVLLALRQYEEANGVLPCPADASLPTGSANYGKAAVIEGYTTGSGGVCDGGTPAGNYSDSTNNVAIGMVPVRALGLSNDYALDGYGRYITYAVDGYATGNSLHNPVWSVLSEPSTTSGGKIVIDDNGVISRSVVALVSHGANGHGAWLPLNAAGGTGTRLNAGSTDTDENMVNAHAASSTPTFPVNDASINSLVTDIAGHSVTFVKKPPTSTFDDLVVYKNPLWNINQLPVSMQDMAILSPPANGSYTSGQTLTFTLTYPGVVTATNCAGAQSSGTPRLDITISGVTDYAYCQSGSGTNTLTFQYTIQSTDVAYNGISMSSPVDLNSGTITSANGYSNFFSVPNLSGIKIVPPTYVYVADSGNNRIVQFTSTGSYKATVASGLSNGGYGINGLTVDPSGNVWVVYAEQVLKYVYSGGSWSNTVAIGNPVASSKSSAQGQFYSPMGIASDAAGNIWVADYYNARVQVFNNSGTFQFSIGGGSGPGAGCNATPNGSYPACNLETAWTNGAFYQPYGIAVDANNNIWVVDINTVVGACSGGGCYRLEEFKDNGTFLGSYAAGTYPSGDGYINYPSGIQVDANNNIWVVSHNNSALVEYSNGGVYQKAMSNGIGSTNGQFNYLVWFAFDPSGNIWASDGTNNRVEELTSGFSYTTSLTTANGTGLNFPGGIAISNR